MPLSFASEYHKILCPEPPAFLADYARTPLLSRLSGVGLLCGTDWTPLFRNAFFYSRLDHSAGCALIVWHLTHSAPETLAALLHDVSTPAFSHVADFMAGDALSQTATERRTADFILQSRSLAVLLERDGVPPAAVVSAAAYPVADAHVPRLCADRLEYMYPSGAALSGEWTLDEIRENYADITLLKNEDGTDEIGFEHEEQAALYAGKFLRTSLILQRCEDKLAMQLLADTVRAALDSRVIRGGDLYAMSEARIIEQFEDAARKEPDTRFARLFRTFRHTDAVIRSERPLEGCYCVRVSVKRRYVDPLLRRAGGAVRLSRENTSFARAIRDFLSFEDAPFACAKYL